MAQHEDKEAEKAYKDDRSHDRRINLEIDDAIKSNMQHRNGREFLWWLLQIGKVDVQPFSNHALLTSFACGEYNVGLQIKSRIIEADPQGFLTMMKEQYDDRANSS